MKCLIDLSRGLFSLKVPEGGLTEKEAYENEACPCLFVKSLSRCDSGSRHHAMISY